MYPIISINAAPGIRCQAMTLLVALWISPNKIVSMNEQQEEGQQRNIKGDGVSLAIDLVPALEA